MMLRPVLLKLICQSDSIILKSSILNAPSSYGSVSFAPGSLDISLFKWRRRLHSTSTVYLKDFLAFALLIDQVSVAEVLGDELVEGFVEPSNRIGLALMGVVPIGAEHFSQKFPES
jgi:hypothetical protein